MKLDFSSFDKEDAFSESDLPFKVDILDWSIISEEFKKIIAKGKSEILQRGQ